MPVTGILLEQMTGIEPAYSAWEADVLPLNYICVTNIIRHFSRFVKRKTKKRQNDCFVYAQGGEKRYSVT